MSKPNPYQLVVNGIVVEVGTLRQMKTKCREYIRHNPSLQRIFVGNSPVKKLGDLWWSGEPARSFAVPVIDAGPYTK